MYTIWELPCWAGISGNAGLFGSANDLAKLMQMFLNGGSYGDRRYIQQSTLELYTSCYNCEEENHRGFGFNKPVYWEEDEGPACNSASAFQFRTLRIHWYPGLGRSRI